MEIIELNKPGMYRDYVIKALEARDTSLLKALRTGKDTKRLVFLNTIIGMNTYLYQQEKDDCIIFSKTVTDRIEADWIGSVLSGTPKTPPFGFIPSDTADEIKIIFSGILDKIQ